VNNINKMTNIYLILLIIYIFTLLLNYITFNSKKTALQLVNDMGIGYNLGQTFNCCNTIEEEYLENEEIKLFGITLPTKNLVKEIRKNGFKTIRFQVLYSNYIYNNSTINSEWIFKIKELINMVNKLDMYIILSINHTRQFWDTEYSNIEDKYINFWKQIANEFINYDEHLVFESVYEIGYLEYLNSMYNYFEGKEYYFSQDFINIIRNSGGLNNKRLLIVPMISSDYELDLFSYSMDGYKIPKDPYNKLAISLNYYFPSEDYDDYYEDNILEPINLYNNLGFTNEIVPYMEWGSSKNYKDIVRYFDYLKDNFLEKGFPVIIGEVGILNDYIRKNNSIEQFLYTLFSLSYEYEGILPCLWDIPMISSNDNNFYFNKENNKWSDGKYEKIFNKIYKGKFIKSYDYYYQTNLETEDIPFYGYYSIYSGSKRIIKVFINARFNQHIDLGYAIGVYSSEIDYHYTSFSFMEKDGKKQYDGTSIFYIDTSQLDLYYFVQAMAFFDEEYMYINNITVQYEEEYLCFDHISYKSDILKEINN